MTALATSPQGLRVIVTGAAGGIGRAIVEALAESDCLVGACDQAALDDPLFERREVVARATFDLRDPDAVERNVAALIEGLRGLDAVVANAGVVDTIHRAERFPEEEWQKDLDTNLSGHFRVVRAAHPALAEVGDGRVVLISSVAAESGLPGQVAYAASKAGIVGMARTLAAEWGGKGIRVNVVMPGFIGTPKVLALPEKVRDGVLEGVALGRIGAVEELAGAVAFLLSPAAAYVTGTALRVDGGIGLSARSLAKPR